MYVASDIYLDYFLNNYSKLPGSLLIFGSKINTMHTKHLQCNLSPGKYKYLKHSLLTLPNA